MPKPSRPRLYCPHCDAEASDESCPHWDYEHDPRVPLHRAQEAYERARPNGICPVTGTIQDA